MKHSIQLAQHKNAVMSTEHPVSGGGGVSESRFNVRDGWGKG